MVHAIVLFGFSWSSVCFISSPWRKGKYIFTWFSQNHPGVSAVIECLKLQLGALLRCTGRSDPQYLLMSCRFSQIRILPVPCKTCNVLNELCARLAVSTSSSCSWGSPPHSHCAQPQTLQLDKQQYILDPASSQRGVIHLNIPTHSVGLTHAAQNISTNKHQ